MKCPICASTASGAAPELEVFFEMAAVPVFCNVLHDSPEKARSTTRGDIRLGWCADCGMIHNVAFDPALVEYVEGYENSLHCSPKFQEFAEELADRLVEKYQLKDATVIEIGAHRGEFLELLCAEGRNRGLGYDPSSPEELCEVVGRPFQLRTDFFEPGMVDGDVGLFLTRHVLEHVTDPVAFVRLMLDAAKRGGDSAVYVEVPNGLWTLRDLGIWDIIYEHCSYFVPTALRRCFASHDGDPHVRETFGGQFLSAEVPTGDDAPRTEEEDAGDLPKIAEYVEAFTGAYQERTDYWRTELEKLAEADDGLAIWGAGSKGVTFLNILAGQGETAAASAIRGVVDINPLKQGKFVAGTGHEIIGPSGVIDRRVKRVIAMNPLYLGEIREMLEKLGYTGTVEAIG
ncbi:MAG: class I SAM-dependent methyltransferase [Planctomycetota bacterium]